MSQISFNDKLSIIWKMISSSYIYLVILGLFLVLAYLFSTTNRSNQKPSKLTYSIIYLVIFGAIIVQYGSGIQLFFEYLMNHLAVLFYFPNISVYFVMILATNLILWISIFSDKTDRNIKRINSIVFCLLHYLLVLVLGIVGQQKLDIFTLESLYSSQEAMSLVELSNLIFVIWILILIIYRVIKSYQIKKGVIQMQTIGGYEVKQQFDLKKAYLYENRISDFREGYQSTKQIEAPKLEEKVEQAEVEDTQNQPTAPEPFSLEDYQLLLEILEEHRQEKAKKEKEEQALKELSSLYKSIDE